MSWVDLKIYVPAAKELTNSISITAFETNITISVAFKAPSGTNSFYNLLFAVNKKDIQPPGAEATRSLKELLREFLSGSPHLTRRQAADRSVFPTAAGMTLPSLLRRPNQKLESGCFTIQVTIGDCEKEAVDDPRSAPRNERHWRV